MKVLKISKTLIRKVDMYMGIGDALVATSDDNNDDPLIISDAMKDVDSNAWQEAMNIEIVSMYSNKVWELVDLLEGVKPMRCRRIYKRNICTNERMETIKARMVTKG